MHTDAFEINDALAKKLIDAQFPEYRSLKLERLSSSGTDNVIYRLGDEFCLRLPLIPSASDKLLKETKCLPILPKLPLQTPMVVAVGDPFSAYNSCSAIYRWIEGDEVSGKVLSDEQNTAETLAEFIRTLQKADVSQSLQYKSGSHNNFRGCRLIERDKLTQNAIQGVSDLFDRKKLANAWAASLELPELSTGPVWVHGDIHAGNLLMRDGNITAVIDFGLMGIGDPAVDLIAAWSLLSESGRAHFRDILDVDASTWFRGRGWALSIALIALAYYRDTNAYLANMSMRVISRVLEDVDNWR